MKFLETGEEHWREKERKVAEILRVFKFVQMSAGVLR